jgi:hypothetical protein
MNAEEAREFLGLSKDEWQRRFRLGRGDKLYQKRPFLGRLYDQSEGLGSFIHIHRKLRPSRQ